MPTPSKMDTVGTGSSYPSYREFSYSNDCKMVGTGPTPGVRLVKRKSLKAQVAVQLKQYILPSGCNEFVITVISK